MSIQRLAGKPQDEVLRNVPDTDHRVTVTNGTPGMRKVVLRVNGKYFGQHRLKPGQVRKFTIGTAMKPRPREQDPRPGQRPEGREGDGRDRQYRVDAR